MNILLLCIVLSHSLYAADQIKNVAKDILILTSPVAWIYKFGSSAVNFSKKATDLSDQKKLKKEGQDVLQRKPADSEVDNNSKSDSKVSEALKKDMEIFIKKEIIYDMKRSGNHINIVTKKSNQGYMKCVFPYLRVQENFKEGYTDLMVQCYLYGLCIAHLWRSENINEELLKNTNTTFQNLISQMLVEGNTLTKEWQTVLTLYDQVHNNKNVLPYNAFMIFFVPFFDSIRVSQYSFDNYSEYTNDNKDFAVNNPIKKYINNPISFFVKKLNRLKLIEQINVFDSLLSMLRDHESSGDEYSYIWRAMGIYFFKKMVNKVVKDNRLLASLMLLKYSDEIKSDSFRSYIKDLIYIFNNKQHCFDPMTIKQSLLAFRVLKKEKKIVIHTPLQGDIIFRATGLNPYTMNLFLKNANTSN